MQFKRNNPLNIRYSSKNNWLGQVGEENGFCVFEHARYGVRAAYMILQKYWWKYDLTTIEKIIERWAPPSENPTARYVRYVKDLYPLPLSTLDGSRKMFIHLLSAMACFESGQYVSVNYIKLMLSECDL